MKAFRIRLPGRDQQTDRDRVGSVVQPIEAAIASAEKERSALALRVKNAQDLAAFAAGNGTDDYLIPDLIDQNPCAHRRNPMDMIFQGRSMSVFQA
jgi:hypothetical protein